MKYESNVKVKHGCCYPETETKPIGRTGTFSILNQPSSTSGILDSPLLVLGSEERKAVEAHKLLVELRRSMAIEKVKWNTIR